MKKIVVTCRKKDSGYDIRNLVKLMTLVTNRNDLSVERHMELLNLNDEEHIYLECVEDNLLLIWVKPDLGICFMLENDRPGK